MESPAKDPGKLTLSEWQAQEWEASQPYGKWGRATFFGLTAFNIVFNILHSWLDLPLFVYFGVSIPLFVLYIYCFLQLREIRKRRDAEQKQAMEQRWKQEDEQLFGQRT
jgi:hypothetical protein